MPAIRVEVRGLVSAIEYVIKYILAEYRFVPLDPTLKYS